MSKKLQPFTIINGVIIIMVLIIIFTITEQNIFCLTCDGSGY